MQTIAQLFIIVCGIRLHKIGLISVPLKELIYRAFHINDDHIYTEHDLEQELRNMGLSNSKCSMRINIT
jgi:hypothetical protein